MAADPAMAEDEDYVLHKGYVSNVQAEIGWWSGFADEPDQKMQFNPSTLIALPVKPVRTVPKVGRNDPCPCGSGKKYKKYHGASWVFAIK